MNEPVPPYLTAGLPHGINLGSPFGIPGAAEEVRVQCRAVFGIQVVEEPRLTRMTLGHRR